jgi:A118 family predicted phage portal protein
VSVLWLFDKLSERVGATGQRLLDDICISPAMANHITESLRAFYMTAPWAKAGMKQGGLPITVTGYMATLVTNEISIGCGPSLRADYIQSQIDAGLIPRLQNAMQLAGAGGEVIVRPFVAGGKIFFDIVTAGRFFPTRFNAQKEVEAGFICDYADKKEESFVRVEAFDLNAMQRKLTITNRAYRNTQGGFGGEVPLNTVAAWAELEPETVIKNIDFPLMAALSMPFPNTVDDASPLPCSLYANATEAMEEFDRILSEFWREIHTGKRKRIVERAAIRPRKGNSPRLGEPPWVGWHDDTTDTYLVIDPEEQAKPFDDYSPELRVEGYIRALDTALRMVENQCMISPGTFTIDCKSERVTATQIISEDRTTYNTCAAIQQRGMKEGLCRLVKICDILCDLYGLAPAGEVVPTVVFGDSIFEDTDKEFSRRMQLVSAGVETAVRFRMWYFGEDEETAKSNLPDSTALLEE